MLVKFSLLSPFQIKLQSAEFVLVGMAVGKDVFGTQSKVYGGAYLQR